MLSETLAEGLSAYRIGDKIRALRKAKRLGLVRLGEHTGLSSGMLSRIERGQIVPTLPTLLRIALVFGVGLDHFFSEDRERPAFAVVRGAERLRLPEQSGSAAPAYFFESLDFRATDRRMDAFLAVFPAGAAASEPHRHPGAEFVYVLEGAVDVEIEGGGGHSYKAGDSFVETVNAWHNGKNRASTPAKLLVVFVGVRGKPNLVR